MTRRDLRVKYKLADGLTDRELFAKYPLCRDQWQDAGLVETFFYVLGCHALEIPDSWLETILEFKRELVDMLAP